MTEGSSNGVRIRPLHVFNEAFPWAAIVVALATTFWLHGLYLSWVTDPIAIDACRMGRAPIVAHASILLWVAACVLTLGGLFGRLLWDECATKILLRTAWCFLVCAAFLGWLAIRISPYADRIWPG